MYMYIHTNISNIYKYTYGYIFIYIGAKKSKGIIQWVSQGHAIKAELALFDRLFTTAFPGKGQEDGNFLLDLNPSSLTLLNQAYVEPSLLSCLPGETFQVNMVLCICHNITIVFICINIY
jgi:hypothetical protein